MFEIFGLLAAILGTAITAGSNWFANQQNLTNQQNLLHEQQNFSAQQAAIANERQLQNWEQTESPQARVQQYKDEGLSVGLMYGGGASGGVSTAPMAATPSASLPVMNPLLERGLNDIFENLKTMKDTKKTEVDTEKGKVEIKEIESKIKVNVATEINTQLQNKLAELDVEIKTATKDTQIDIIKKQYEAINNAVKEAKERIKLLEVENKYKDDYMNAELNNLSAQFWKTTQETFLAYANEQLTWAKKELTEAQKELTEEERQYYESMIQKIEADTRIIKTRADHYESEFYVMEFGHDGETGIVFGCLNQMEEFAEKWRDRKKKKEGLGGAGGKF